MIEHVQDVESDARVLSSYVTCVSQTIEGLDTPFGPCRMEVGVGVARLERLR